MANLDLHMDIEVNRDDQVSFLWRSNRLPNFGGTAAAFLVARRPAMIAQATIVRLPNTSMRRQT
ncbi:hypothetical protein VB618_00125 [Microvirga sp. CF3062]|uniref:hypothetical protein n=1 Tax=Microvirga sp. CF3062 TaxID=3110182 RepID=UPI002E78D9E9|nr:hypothetical protein [Microvirga sp. CF3062]MEE1654584.1 hypothetical protein [Microvirga sp. CF3062]